MSEEQDILSIIQYYSSNDTYLATLSSARIDIGNVKDPPDNWPIEP